MRQDDRRLFPNEILLVDRVSRVDELLIGFHSNFDRYTEWAVVGAY